MSEHDQKLEKESDIKKKVSFFSFFVQDWKPLSPCIRFSISIVPGSPYYSFQKNRLLKDWVFLSSFFHSVNLVFHEAGHLLFAVVGNRTHTILGCSINQLPIPLIVLITFFYKRDTAKTVFAMFGFFANFLDLGIYMADARFLKLPLIGGLGMEAHDWRNLFNRFDLWSVDQLLSLITFYSGWLGIIITEA